ncbi:DUF262 domain-containing protein [Photobacterium leiognathi]|uniref:DUF262 domain-containing protein n=1 Tax=Photobacterium leiognathi TaxID=553611 RepID=UPI002980E970|nr:DUF262 domain-containing protein [Photobacterium leiognathi]
MELIGAKIRSFKTVTSDMNDSGSESIGQPKKVKIPHYQRPYRWEEENITRLLDDWHAEQSNSYFSGSIVTVSSSSDATRPHELIDGQQRFTTIYLANYVRFMITRIAIRQAINSNRQLDIAPLFDKLIDSAIYVFSSQNSEGTIKSYFSDIKDRVIESISDDDPENGLEHYCSAVGLPSMMVEADDEYDSEHLTKYSEFLDKFDLSLSYDRSSFNYTFRKVLSHTCFKMSDQSYISLINDTPIEASIEETYCTAIKVIFNNFNEMSDQNKKPYDKAKEILALIERFLDEVKVCVIQTGNEKDAYTLFEVLNDRSLALDDLDLIKNQFYKSFVLANPSMDDKKVDVLLQSLDEQWVDNIYSKCSESAKKLTTYLAVTYITGNTDIVYNSNEGYRNAISEYLSEKKKYDCSDIKKHFNIFESCRKFIDIFGVTFKSKDLKAIDSEYSDFSVLHKAVHFLIASKQEGVLAGLVAYVLNYINTKNSGLSKCPFDIDRVTKILEKMLNDDCPSNISHQATYFWRTSMLAKSAKEPRDLAVSCISMNSADSTVLSRPIPYHKNLNKDFLLWLDGWRYGNNNLKIRILFTRLIKLDLDESQNTLLSRSIGLKFDVSNLQVDHLEARNIDENNSESYFEHEERNFYVEGLGNMMPLPSKENREKSNAPMKSCFDYIADSGFPDNHFLVRKTREIYEEDENRNVVTGAPNELFFTKRKELIKELFVKSIELDFS